MLHEESPFWLLRYLSKSLQIHLLEHPHYFPIIKCISRSCNMAHLESHAYSIDGVCQHVDRKGGRGGLDRVCNHLEKRPQNNCL